MNKQTTQATEPGILTENLPLDVIRTIYLNSAKRSYGYIFRRITCKDWERFFGQIIHQTIQQGQFRDTVYESESAGIDLVDRTLGGVKGYDGVEGLKNWKAALPLKHRMAVALVLRSVSVLQPKADAPLSEFLEVQLEAAWSSTPDGKTTMYSGLVHRFHQPTIEQLRRFNFESSRVRVEGTAENGVTTYPSRQLVAMRIYDELVHSVEGYSVAGKPLTIVEEIRSEMDGAHKAEAALALFNQGDNVQVI